VIVVIGNSSISISIYIYTLRLSPSVCVNVPLRPLSGSSVTAAGLDGTAISANKTDNGRYNRSNTLYTFNIFIHVAFELFVTRAQSRTGHARDIDPPLRVEFFLTLFFSKYVYCIFTNWCWPNSLSNVYVLGNQSCAFIRTRPRSTVCRLLRVRVNQSTRGPPLRISVC